jgi:hypothetical protein
MLQALRVQTLLSLFRSRNLARLLGVLDPLTFFPYTSLFIIGTKKYSPAFASRLVYKKVFLKIVNGFISFNLLTSKK